MPLANIFGLFSHLIHHQQIDPKLTKPHRIWHMTYGLLIWTKYVIWTWNIYITRTLSFFTGLGTEKASAASFAISAYAAKTKTFYYSWPGWHPQCQPNQWDSSSVRTCENINVVQGVEKMQSKERNGEIASDYNCCVAKLRQMTTRYPSPENCQ